MTNTNQDVEVYVNNKPIRKFAHNGRSYIEARAGQEYSVKVRNNGSRQILAVVSVDGINVVDGQAAGSTKMGYIIHGFSSFEVKGFRVSNNGVHPFKFNQKDKSYASKSDVTQGDTSNCGVIGIQVYDEKRQPEPKVIWRDRIVEKPFPYPVFPYNPPIYREPYVWMTTSNNTRTYSSNLEVKSSLADQIGCFNMSSNTPVACAGGPVTRGIPDDNLCFSPAQDNGTTCTDWDMGTEFSKHEISDTVQEVEFEIGSLINTIEIFYASRESLIHMGVPVVKESAIPKIPSAFPSKFCKPPKT